MHLKINISCPRSCSSWSLLSDLMFAGIDSLHVVLLGDGCEVGVVLLDVLLVAQLGPLLALVVLPVNLPLEEVQLALGLGFIQIIHCQQILVTHGLLAGAAPAAALPVLVLRLLFLF